MLGRKVIVNLGLLLTFLVVAVGAVQVVKITNQGDIFLTTSSPKGSYVVSLTGRKDRPKLPMVNHEVRFSLAKTGKASLTNKYLHSGDWFDPSFDLLYPQHNWVQENVLQFYKEEFFNEGERQSIVVQNKTKRGIGYLRVTSIDSFLLFDIQPGATITLVVSAPRADNTWITVEGEFFELQQIRQTGVGFLFPKGRKGPFAYNVYVNEDDVTIESPGLEKYKGTI
jgi:hypothetical protein